MTGESLSSVMASSDSGRRRRDVLVRGVRRLCGRKRRVSLACSSLGPTVLPAGSCPSCSRSTCDRARHGFIQKVKGISDARFPCSLCQRVFSTKQALAVHSFRAHQHVQTTRGFVDTPYCCACLQLFGSSPNVVAHLEAGSSRCKAGAVGTLPQLSLAQMSELDQLDAVRGEATCASWPHAC